MKPSWSCISGNSPTQRLPRSEATLGSLGGQLHSKACGRSKQTPPNSPTTSQNEAKLGFYIREQPHSEATQNRSHAGVPWWTTSLRGLHSGKREPQWGRDTNRRAGLVVAILPHDTGVPRCLSRGSRTAVCSARMVEGVPQRVTGGFGLTVPSMGLRGAPKLVAGLVPPQCPAQLAHAGGRGPRTTPKKKRQCFQRLFL